MHEDPRLAPWALFLRRSAAAELGCLIPLGSFVAGFLGFVGGHEFAVFGFAVPAAALVINAGVEIDPDFMAGFGGGDVGGGVGLLCSGLCRWS